MLIPETGKKRTFIRTMAFIMAQVFFVTSLGYAEPIYNKNLRVPMGRSKDRMKTALGLSGANQGSLSTSAASTPQILQDTKPLVSAEKLSLPAGSPFQVFRVLLQTKEPLTASQVAADLNRAQSTIDRDLGSLVGRNLVQRNGLARASNTTYELTPLVKARAEEIMKLLASMGHRPTGGQWKAVQPEIEKLLTETPLVELSAAKPVLSVGEDDAKEADSLHKGLPKKVIRDMSKVDAKTNWSDPEALTLRHFQYGILKREDFLETYSYLEGLLKELWAVADAPDTALPKLVLLEEEVSDRFFEDGYVYISLGLIKDIRKQRIGDAYPEGMVYREDLAFVLAFEIAYYFQLQKGVKMDNQHQLHAAIRDADRRAFDLMESAGYSVQYVFDIFSTINKSKSYHNRSFVIGKIQQMIEWVQSGKFEELFSDKTSVDLLEDFFDSFLPTFTRFSGVILAEEQIASLKSILASRDIPQLVEAMRQMKIDRKKIAEAVTQQYGMVSEIDFKAEAEKIWAARPRPLEAVRESLAARGIASSDDLIKTLRENMDAGKIEEGFAGLSDMARNFLEGDPLASVKEKFEKAMRSSVYLAVMMQLNFLLQTVVELAGTGVVPQENIEKAKGIIAKTDMSKMRTIGDAVGLARQLSSVVLKEETVEFVFDAFPAMVVAGVQQGLDGKLKAEDIDIFKIELLDSQRAIIEESLKSGEITSLKDLADLIHTLLSTVLEEKTSDFVADQVSAQARMKFAGVTQGKLSDAQKDTVAGILAGADVKGSRDALNVVHNLLGIFFNEHLVEFTFNEIEASYRSFTKQQGVEDRKEDTARKGTLSDQQKIKIKQVAEIGSPTDMEDVLKLVQSLLSNVINEEMAQFAFNYIRIRLNIDPAKIKLTDENIAHIKDILNQGSVETEQEAIDLILEIINAAKEIDGEIRKELKAFIETGLKIYRMELLPDEKIAIINKAMDPGQVYTVTDIIAIIHSLLATVMSEETASVAIDNIAAKIGSSVDTAVKGELPKQLEEKAKGIINIAEFNKKEDVMALARNLMSLVMNKEMVDFIFGGLDETVREKAFRDAEKVRLKDKLNLGNIFTDTDVMTAVSSMLEVIMSPDMARYTVKEMDSLLSMRTGKRLSTIQLEEIRGLVKKANIANPQELAVFIFELLRIASPKSADELLLSMRSLNALLDSAVQIVKGGDLTSLQLGRVKEIVEEYKSKQTLGKEDILSLIEKLLPIIITPAMVTMGWGLAASRFEALLQLTSKGALTSKVAKVISEAELVTYEDYFNLIHSLAKMIMSEKAADIVLGQFKMRSELLFKSTLGKKIPDAQVAKIREVLAHADTGTFSDIAKTIDSLTGVFGKKTGLKAKVEEQIQSEAVKQLDKMAGKFRFVLPVAAKKMLMPGKKRTVEKIIAETKIENAADIIVLIDKLLLVIMDKPEADNVSSQIRSQLAPFVAFYDKTGLTARQIKAIHEKLLKADFEDTNSISKLIYDLVSILVNGRVENTILERIDADILSTLPIAVETKLPGKKKGKAEKIIKRANIKSVDDAIQFMHELLRVIMEQDAADQVIHALTVKYGSVFDAYRKEGQLSRELQTEISKLPSSFKEITTPDDILNLIRSLMSILVRGKTEGFVLDELASGLAKFLPKYAGDILNSTKKEKLTAVLKKAKYEKPDDVVKVIYNLVEIAMGDEAGPKMLSELSLRLEPVIKLYGDEGLTPKQINALGKVLDPVKIAKIETSGQIAELVLEAVSILASEKLQDTVLNELTGVFKKIVPKSSGEILNAKKIESVKAIFKDASLKKPKDVFDLIKELIETTMDKATASKVLSELSSYLEPVIKMYGEEGLTPGQISAISAVIEKFIAPGNLKDGMTSKETLGFALELTSILANEKFQDFVFREITEEIEPILPASASRLLAAKKRAAVKRILAGSTVEQPQDILKILHDIILVTVDKETAEALFSDISRQLDPVVKMYGEKGLTRHQMERIRKAFMTIDYDDPEYAPKLIRALSSILINGSVRHFVSVEISNEIKNLLGEEVITKDILDGSGQVLAEILKTAQGRDFISITKALLLIIAGEEKADEIMQEITANHKDVFELYEKEGISPELELEILTVFKSASNVTTSGDVMNIVISVFSIFVREMTKKITTDKLEGIFRDTFTVSEDKELSQETIEAVFKIINSEPKIDKIKEVFSLLRVLLLNVTEKPKIDAFLKQVSWQGGEIAKFLSKDRDDPYMSSEQREAISQILKSVKYLDTSGDVYNLVYSIISVLSRGNQENAAVKKLETRLSSSLPKGFFKNKKLSDKDIAEIARVSRLDQVDEIFVLLGNLFAVFMEEQAAQAVLNRFFDNHEKDLTIARKNGLSPQQLLDILEILRSADSINAFPDVMKLTAEIMAIVINKKTEDFVMDQIAEAVKYQAPIFTAEILSADNRLEIQRLISQADFSTPQDVIETFHKLALLTMKKEVADALLADITNQIAPRISMDQGLGSGQVKRIREAFEAVDLDDAQFVFKLVNTLIPILFEKRVQESMAVKIVHDIEAILPEPVDQKLGDGKTMQAKDLLDSDGIENIDEALQLVEALLSLVTGADLAGKIIGKISEDNRGVFAIYREEGLPEDQIDEFMSVVRAEHELMVSKDIINLAGAMLATVLHKSMEDYALDQIAGRIESLLPKTVNEILSEEKRADIKRIIQDSHVSHAKDVMDLVDKLIKVALDDSAVVNKALSELSARLTPIIKMYGEDGLTEEQIGDINNILSQADIKDIHSLVKLINDLIDVIVTEKFVTSALKQVVEKLEKSTVVNALASFRKTMEGKLIDGDSSVEEVKVPYFETHPPDEERKTRMRGYTSNRYFKGYFTPPHALPEELFAEVDKPGSARLDMEVLNNPNIRDVERRISEQDDWQEMIFFVAGLDDQFRSSELYDYVMENLKEAAIDDMDRDIFIFQFNFLFQKPELNNELGIVQDKEDFLAYIPILPEAIRESKVGDRKYNETHGARLKSFMQAYNQYIYGLFKNIVEDETNPGKYIRILIERYEKVFEMKLIADPSPFMDILTGKLQLYSRLEDISEDTAMKLLKLRRLVFPTRASASPFFDTLIYHQLRQNEGFVREFTQKEMGSFYMADTFYSALEREFHNTEFAGLGSTYEDTIRSLYSMFFEMDQSFRLSLGAEEGMPFLQKQFFQFWIRAVHDKFRPGEEHDDGSYTFKFINFITEFFNEKKVDKTYYSHAIFQLSETLFYAGEKKKMLLFDKPYLGFDAYSHPDGAKREALERRVLGMFSEEDPIEIEYWGDPRKNGYMHPVESTVYTGKILDIEKSREYSWYHTYIQTTDGKKLELDKDYILKISGWRLEGEEEDVQIETHQELIYDTSALKEKTSLFDAAIKKFDSDREKKSFLTQLLESFSEGDPIEIEYTDAKGKEKLYKGNIVDIEKSKENYWSKIYIKTADNKVLSFDISNILKIYGWILSFETADKAMIEAFKASNVQDGDSLLIEGYKEDHYSSYYSSKKQRKVETFTGMAEVRSFKLLGNIKLVLEDGKDMSFYPRDILKIYVVKQERVSPKLRRLKKTTDTHRASITRYLLENVITDEKKVSNIFKGSPREWLDSLSMEGLNLLYLFSKGVMLDFEELSGKYLYKMPSKEVWSLYILMKEYFTPELLEKLNLLVLENPDLAKKIEDSGVGISMDTFYASPKIKTFEGYLLNIFIYLTHLNAYEKKAVMTEFDDEHGSGYYERDYTEEQKRNVLEHERRRKERLNAAFFNTETGHYGGAVFSDIFIGEVASERNTFQRMLELFSDYEKPPTPRLRIQENGLADFTQWDARRKYVELYYAFDTTEEVLNSLNPAYPKWSGGDKLDWKKRVEIVVSCIPPSVFRNYFLYFLFCKEISPDKYTSPALFLNNKELQEAIAVALEGDKAAETETPDARKKRQADFIKKFSVMARYFVKDSFIDTLNKNEIQKYLLFYGHSLSMGEFKIIEQLTPQEQAHYDKYEGYFEDFGYDEYGTHHAYLDLQLGEYFKEYLTRVIQDETDFYTLEEKLGIIKNIFSARTSNTRDCYLQMLITGLSLEKISTAMLVEIAGLMNGQARKDAINLELLEREAASRTGMSFYEELSMIEKYFSERSYLRDDILMSLEAKRVSSVKDLEEIRKRLTSDISTATDEEVAKREEVMDNIVSVLDKISAQAKIEVILWILGQSNEKPDVIKKLELVTFAKFDNLFNGASLHRDKSSMRYKGIGNKEKEFFFEMLLLKGKDSIIGGGHTLNLVEQIIEIIYKNIGISQAQASGLKIVDVLLKSFVRNMSHDPERLGRILISLMSEVERLKNDPAMQGASSDLKLAKITRVFLGSLGAAGIKIGQFLSTTTVFHLPDELREELGGLKGNATSVDMASIFSVLASVGLGDVMIEEGVLANASIKVILKVKGVNRILKVKKLQVYYEAIHDMDLIDNILKDLEPLGFISEKDRKDIVVEIRMMIEKEANFEIEKENTEKLSRNNSNRFKSRFYRIMFWIASKLWKIDRYHIGFPNIFRVLDNMVIDEEFIPGTSLGQYQGQDKRIIYISVLSELLRQLFLDHFVHTDPHDENLLIRKNGGDVPEIYFIDMGDTASTSFVGSIAPVGYFAAIAVMNQIQHGLLHSLAEKIALSLQKYVSTSMLRFFGKITYLFGKPAGQYQHMGKRGQAVSLDMEKKTAAVKDSKGKLHAIKLNPLTLNPSALKQEFEIMPDIKDEHRRLILSVLSLLENSPPHLYMFTELIEDLFGFSSYDENLIVIYKKLSDNPVALFHEIGEYLIASGILKLEFKDNNILISINGEEFSEPLQLTREDAIKQAEKNPHSAHYLLRAFQREIFGNRDKDLTDFIKTETSSAVSARLQAEFLKYVIEHPKARHAEIVEAIGTGRPQTVIEKPKQLTTLPKDKFATVILTEVEINLLRHMINAPIATHAEIAEAIGIVRETVSRHISRIASAMNISKDARGGDTQSAILNWLEAQGSLEQLIQQGVIKIKYTISEESIIAACSRLDGNIGDDLEIIDVAEELGVSPGSLKNWLSKEFKILHPGENYKDYFKRARSGIRHRSAIDSSI